jgi:hypothetical protein
MSQSGYSNIQIYASGTTGHTPSASNLNNSSSGAELAINYYDGLLFYKDASGNVQTLASKTATAGNFVNIMATTSVVSPTIGSASGSSLSLQSNGTTNATLDTNGNLGLGVTPSAWNTTYKAFQISGGGYITFSNMYGQITANSYLNTSGVTTYIANGYATQYAQGGGQHTWSYAGYGTAGNPITFTPGMTLDASGNFIVGGTTATNTSSGRGNITLNGSSSAIISIGVGGVEKGYIYTQGTDIIANADSGGFSVQTATANPITFITNGSERGRFDSSGNLMVGQTSATGKLSVTGSGTSNTGILAITSTDSTDTFIWGSQTFAASIPSGSNIIHMIGQSGSTKNSGYIGYKWSSSGSNSNLLTFGHYGNDNLMNLDASGNLLVGTTTASGKVTFIDSNTTSATNTFVVNTTANSQAFFCRSDGYIASPYTYGATSASAANVVIGNGGYFYRATSSLKYKTNVQNAVHGLAEVLKLRPVTYQGKSEVDAGKTFGGLVAEEVDKIGLTEFVQYAEDGTPDALHYANMVSLAFKAIQEQQALITSLTSRISALEAKGA